MQNELQKKLKINYLEFISLVNKKKDEKRKI